MAKSDPKVSAVLLMCQRTHNIPRILESLDQYEFIDEFVIWDNSTGDWRYNNDLCDLITNPARNVRILGANRNNYTLGRYSAAKEASNDIIYTQDDDVLVSGVDELYRRHLETNRLACYLDEAHIRYGHRHYVHHYTGGTAYETLVGWGSVFSKHWVDILDEYTDRYGVDELLKRKADRAFTILIDVPHEQIAKTPNHLPGAYDKDALYRQTDHWSLNRQMGDRCRMILEDKNSPIGTKGESQGC